MACWLNFCVRRRIRPLTILLVCEGAASIVHVLVQDCAERFSLLVFLCNLPLMHDPPPLGVDQLEDAGCRHTPVLLVLGCCPIWLKIGLLIGSKASRDTSLYQRMLLVVNP